MPTLFHVTVRSEQDEVMEFDSTQPVVHIDLPPGRFFITVRCFAEEAGTVTLPAREGTLH